MLTIAEDDLSDRSIAGYRKQVIYDEGSSLNGLNLVNDEGIIRAQLIQDEEISEVITTQLLEDTGSSVPFSPMQDASLNLMLWLDAADRESMDQGTSLEPVDHPVTVTMLNSGEIKLEIILMQWLPLVPKYRTSGILGTYPSVETASSYFDLTNSNLVFDALEELSVMFVHKWTTATNTWNSMVWKGSGRGWGFVGTFVLGK